MIRRASLSVGILFLGACGDSSTNPPDNVDPRVASVEITPPSLSLMQGADFSLRATVRGQDGAERTDVEVSWASDAPAVAGVDAGGLVIALTPGTAPIIASAGGVADTAMVLVQVTWIDIAASIWWRHSCGLSVDGTAFCWGANEYGQLGDGSTDDRSVPTPVRNQGQPLVKIVTGSIHSCGLTEDGQVYCWGANASGQVGDGTTVDKPAATLVSNTLQFTDIVAGGFHTCGLTDSGMYCWGSNETHQLGIQGTGTGDHRPVPTPVLESFSFSAIDAGMNHTCGADDGVAYCWGWNEHGQLGNGTIATSYAPVVVGSQANFASLALAYLHSCGLDVTSSLYCWGTYVGNSTILPELFTHIRLASVAAGTFHLCGVSASENAVLCWGANGSGQLGDGSTDWRTSPNPVQSLGPIVQVVAGSEHTCAIGVDRHAYCWGLNDRGQLGLGAPGDVEELPRRVAEPEDRPILGMPPR